MQLLERSTFYQMLEIKKFGTILAMQDYDNT
jgi:hypothetical protein